MHDLSCGPFYTAHPHTDAKRQNTSIPGKVYEVEMSVEHPWLGFVI